MADKNNRKSEIRKHYYLDQYVVISPSRHHSLNHPPFTPGGKWTGQDPETTPANYVVKDAYGHWLVKAIPNLFSAFTPDNDKARGYHEVILDANPLSTPFSELSVEHVELILNTYCQRVSALMHQPHIKYVSVYHNTGAAAGASVQATHSQVAAISLVPPDLKHKAEAFSRSKKRYGTSPILTAINFEEEQKARVVLSDKQAITICPFASQFPYETWLIPRRHVRSICDLKSAEVKSLAKMLHSITKVLEKNQLSYNFMLEESIREMDGHFLIRVTPRPNTWAGFEFNTGMAINAMPPEDACAWYRGEIKHVSQNSS